MKSTFGVRGAICEAYGWTYDYVVWGISWNILQRMMSDKVEVRRKKKKPETMTLTENNVDEFLKFINFTGKIE